MGAQWTDVAPAKMRTRILKKALLICMIAAHPSGTEIGAAQYGVRLGASCSIRVILVYSCSNQPIPVGSTGGLSLMPALEQMNARNCVLRTSSSVQLLDRVDTKSFAIIALVVFQE